MGRTIARLAAAGSVEDIALRSEFERAYRTPGVKYLGAACTLGACAVLSYYLLDVFHTGLPWTGGAQTVRLSLAAMCALVAALCWANIDIATRYYGPIFGVIVTVIEAAACLISYMLHATEPPAALVWGIADLRGRHHGIQPPDSRFDHGADKRCTDRCDRVDLDQ